VSAAPTGAPADILPAGFEAYVDRAMAETGVPGLSIVVVRPGHAPLVQGFGVRRLGRPERVDGNTVFNIASLTKSFTSAAAAILVDEGKLGWDDPVKRWLPAVEFSDPWISREVTLRDLLSHRTGIDAADTTWLFTGVNRGEMIRRLRYMQPQAPFRTRQVYANTPFTLGGEMAAAAAQMKWEDLVRTRIFAPLAMRSAGFGPATGSNLASPHARIDGKLQPIRQSDYTNIGPAGSIHASPSDMVAWMRLQLGKGEMDGRRLISAAAVEEMHQPQTIIPTTPQMRAGRKIRLFAGYGLGWNVMDYMSRKIVWHSGSAEGMHSYMALLPVEGIGILVLANSQEAGALRGQVAERLIDHHLGIAPVAAQAAPRSQPVAPPPAPAARPPVRPPLPSSAYAGSFHHDLYGQLAVRNERGRLNIQIDQGQTGDLEHVDGDLFRVVWHDPFYRSHYPSTALFEVADAGGVRTLRLNLDGQLILAARQ
jgi:CubicO group peptidase (beta-lactamase class C family)